MTLIFLFDLPVCFAFDFNHATKPVLLEDAATFEMYRARYYGDQAGTSHLASMSVFPAGRRPLPPDVLLDPSVPPAKFPASG